MKESGLEEYHVSSSRSASSSSCLLMGLPLDMIVCRVGWLHVTNFVRHYLKPVEKAQSRVPASLDKVPHVTIGKPPTIKVPLPQTGRKVVIHTPPPTTITEPGDLEDPYGFVDHIRTNFPKTL